MHFIVTPPALNRLQNTIVGALCGNYCANYCDIIAMATQFWQDE